MIPPPMFPPFPPPPPPPGPEAFIIGSIIALLAGFFTALSMVVNRYALAHATPHRVSWLPFTVRPWMVWFFAMFLYNVGATALASVAQIFIPLSLFACLFITLLVVNIFLARALLKEKITPPKVMGAALIMLGAIMAGAGTPIGGGQLQEEFPCTHGEKCVYERINELALTPEAIALQATLFSLTFLSIIAIIYMEIRYPASDLKRTGPAKSAASKSPKAAKKTSTSTSSQNDVETPGEGKSADGAAAAKPSASQKPPRLAPRWLERVMAFVYPASMGLDEGIAHLWLRADTSMLTQCDVGGCANGTFAAALGIRWTASVATSFWLIVVFRRYETTVALPIEYGTVTAIDVVSGLLFYREYEHMENWQLALVISGCVVCVIGVAVGIITCTEPEEEAVEAEAAENKAKRFRQPSLPRLSHVVARDHGDDDDEDEEDEEKEAGNGNVAADTVVSAAPSTAPSDVAAQVSASSAA